MRQDTGLDLISRKVCREDCHGVAVVRSKPCAAGSDGTSTLLACSGYLGGILVASRWDAASPIRGSAVRAGGGVRAR